METDGRRELTLQGYVMALDWDDEDFPTVVSVMTDDGTEYEVEEGEIGDELLGLEGAEVEVSGLVDGADPEYPTIGVVSFKVLYDPFAEEADDDAAAEGDSTAGSGRDAGALEEDDDVFEPYDELDGDDPDGDGGEPDPAGAWPVRRRAG